jgi:hypothetical protein
VWLLLATARLRMSVTPWVMTDTIATPPPRSRSRCRPASERSGAMPRIGSFYGIVITMYLGDHPPPHFHARYGKEKATIEIATAAVIKGSSSPRARRLVRERTGLHRAELAANFERVVREESPTRIEPLR